VLLEKGYLTYIDPNGTITEGNPGWALQDERGRRLCYDQATGDLRELDGIQPMPDDLFDKCYAVLDRFVEEGCFRN